MAFLYKADPKRAEARRESFTRLAPDIAFRTWPDVSDARDVRFLAAWLPPDDLASAFPNLEVLFSTGAGVDQLVLERIPARVQLVRMIEPALIATMAEIGPAGCPAPRMSLSGRPAALVARMHP